MTISDTAARPRILPLLVAAASLSILAANGVLAAGSDACVADSAAVAARPQSDAMTTTPLSPDLAEKLDAAVKSVLPYAAAPGVIAGVRTPEGYWKAAFGEADPDTGAPMEVGMFTRIGSVTKPYTGTVLMQLVEQGKLSLDDTIDTYVDGIPNGDRITLRHLANMTSGGTSYTILDTFQEQLFGHPDTIFTADQLLAYSIPESPAFEPGDRFDYSNSNIVLLGLVIEKVTGRSLADVYRTGLFEPLGIEHTYSPGDSAALPDPHPQGFTLQGLVDHPEAATNATNWNPSWSWATGDLIANVDDLLTFGRALGTGQGVLDPATQVQRMEEFPDVWGYGIAVGCVGGWIGHGGSEPGYTTTLFYDTTTDTTVAVQTNSDIVSGDCGDADVLPDNPTGMECSGPALRVFKALSAALGHAYEGY